MQTAATPPPPQFNVALASVGLVFVYIAFKWCTQPKYDPLNDAVDTGPADPIAHKRAQLVDGLFHAIDQNNDSSLSKAELDRVMSNAQVLLEVTGSKKNVLTEKHFKDFISSEVVKHLPEEKVDRMIKLSKIAQAGKNIKRGNQMDGHKLFNSIDLNNDNSLQLSELSAVLGPESAKHFVDAMAHVSKDGEVGRADFVNWASDGGEKFAKLNKEFENINEKSCKETIALVSSAANKAKAAKVKAEAAKVKAAKDKAAAAKAKAEKEKAEKERARAAAAAAEAEKGKGKGFWGSSKKGNDKKSNHKKKSTPEAGSFL